MNYKVENSMFNIGFSRRYKFNVENMKQYDITDKFKDIFKVKETYFLR